MSRMSRSLKSLNTQMIMPLCRGIPASSNMRCGGGRSPVRGAFNLHWKSGSLDPSWSCSTFNICRRTLYTSWQRRSIWYQQYSSIVTHGTNQATKRCTAQIELCVGGGWRGGGWSIGLPLNFPTWNSAIVVHLWWWVRIRLLRYNWMHRKGFFSVPWLYADLCHTDHVRFHHR